ncbi:hypothetical protein GX51_07174 [Blastomyces parvus]|uniref:Uncharacterized protein n=1 Tax=Blastomyces parvus TaxID=2060905 RepID=A0A2B7WMH5_9EURO|nr:hypothetical protein GX51_07174 [Blastomyces parvus]
MASGPWKSDGVLLVGQEAAALYGLTGRGKPEAVAATAGSWHTGVCCGDDGDEIGVGVRTSLLNWYGARVFVFSSGSASVTVNRIQKRKSDSPERFFDLDAE